MWLLASRADGRVEDFEEWAYCPASLSAETGPA